MLNIKSVFFPSDRLDELKEIPRLPNGDVDYWKCAKILCKKDGGHLPSFKEGKELIEWLYEDDNGDSPKVKHRDFTNLEGYKINTSKAKLINLKNWYGTNITNKNVNVYLWLGKEYNSYIAYYRYFNTSDTGVTINYRTSSIRQAVCVGD